jgi:NAD(P)-dependent dehydrogenase (short-subunit alcohol dehydrogenase family)
MAQQGASVVVNYIGSAAAAKEVVDAIENGNGIALAIEAYVSKSDQAQHMISQAVLRLGRIDVRVNNAGIPEGVSILTEA